MLSITLHEFTNIVKPIFDDLNYMGKIFRSLFPKMDENLINKISTKFNVFQFKYQEKIYS